MISVQQLFEVNNNPNIKWKWGQTISERDIENIERKLNIKFPQTYIDIVKKYDGGRPSKDSFPITGNKMGAFESLINLKSNDDDVTMMQTIDAVKDRLPKKVIPFGLDPFGNLICFDYRQNQEPQIVFWNHEQGDNSKSIVKISDNFDTFINSLK